MRAKEENIALAKNLADACVEIVGLTQKLAQSNKAHQKLTDKLCKNSGNSSKPSSTDGFNKPKPKSQRVKSRKKVGGQLGHKGSTLLMIKNPHKTEVYKVSECIICGAICTKTSCKYERRQVFDLVDNQRFVSEHRAEFWECDKCNYVNKASFPECVRAPIQYGPNLKGIVLYLYNRQIVTFQRTSELFAYLFKTKISVGTLVSIIKEASKKLEATDAIIKEAVIEAPVVNFDESGMQVNGVRHWVHVAVTNVVSYFMTHTRRGPEAMDEMGILPDYVGKAVHDHWKSYFIYTNCTHYLCNAHHLRELEFIHERYKHSWAKEMQELLREIKKAADNLMDADETSMPQEDKDNFDKRYMEILAKGYLQDPAVIVDPNKRKKQGRVPQSKGRNLLDRLHNFKASVLGFMHDFTVPFDNNQGERDIRMLKVQQKVSGSFRSEQGPRDYCRLMTYISTIRKNSMDVIEALASIFSGKPILPPFLI